MAYAESTHSASALSGKQQSIIPIAAFTAKGDTEKLKGALAEGLQHGMTVNEIKEVLVQMYAYTGFPRSLAGLNTFIALLDERKAQGIEDEVGRDASPRPDNANIRELGTANQTTVIGRPASGRVYEFAPVIDTFLKEHLFGDIFSRDVLSFQERAGHGFCIGQSPGRSPTALSFELLSGGRMERRADESLCRRP